MSTRSGYVLFKPDDFPDDWTMTEIILYSYIDMHDTSASHCDASLAALAKICRCSEDTVRRILKKFQDQNLITIIPRPGTTNEICITEYLPGHNDTPQEPKPVKSVKPKKEFVAPSFEEWKSYCDSRQIRPDVAKKSFDYYSQLNWRKSNGQKIDNWKGTIIAVWDKPENKVKTGTVFMDGLEIPL